MFVLSRLYSVLIFLTIFVSMISCGDSSPNGIHRGNSALDDGGRGGQTTPVPFVSVWRISNDNESITLPLRLGYNYDFRVDWGDGSFSQITSHDDTDMTHTYITTGDYVVTISGIVEAWSFNNNGSKDKIISVKNLGDVSWRNLKGAFWGCANLIQFHGGNVSRVTDMNRVFSGAVSVNPDVSGWDVSNVTDMSYMFYDALIANPDVSGWDVSNVTNMKGMFFNAVAAKPDVSGWDVSNVTDMSYMFSGAVSVNPDVSGWDVSNVTDMSYMFSGAVSVNPDVSSWDVSNVTDMSYMFANATSVNLDMSQWDFGSVTDMSGMFMGVTLPSVIYNILLIQIDATSEQDGITLDVGDSKYGWSASKARQNLKVNRGWTINDGGFASFVSMWVVSSGMTMTLPLRFGYDYDFTVHWGDGSSSRVTSYDDVDITHTYAVGGNYKIIISGLVEAWYFNGSGSKNNILFVDDLGDVGWKNLEDAFHGCGALIRLKGGNVSGVTDMSRMFASAVVANPDVRGWDVSNVTDMSRMFSDAFVANPDVRGWDVSSVTDMSDMFASAVVANPDVRGWDVSNVTDMSGMFSNAFIANPDVRGWDVSNVTDMSDMFSDAFVANPDVSGWDVSNVTNMSGMFKKAVMANPDVSGWDVSSVTDMSYMFKSGVPDFDAVGWDIFGGRYKMFSAGFANPDVRGWDVSNVTDMSYMFESAVVANPDVSGWDVSSVTDMSGMFSDAFVANPDVSDWDVSNVTNMGEMFWDAVVANPDVSGWDVSNVTSMYRMFDGARAANPDMGLWGFGNVIDMSSMFKDVTLRISTYSDFLNRINQTSQRRNVVLDGGHSKYNEEAIVARNNLVNNLNWVIRDGGPDN